MTSGETQHAPGGHWSAANPIPTIQKFVENLDKDKKERDRKIDDEINRKRQAGSKDVQSTEEQVAKLSKHTREVTDPTSGREITIEDVGKQYMDAVKDPKITVPNSNLDKPTTIKTDPYQEFEEYKQNQDVTAPPDPIAEGTTSDVPIHGEKTNVLFHPTPSVTYQPMFEEIEKRANGLTAGIAITVIVLGKTFGGSLWGLIPLAFCLASGVYLWMKEVIRTGRDFEWRSEQLRGETATANLLPESVEWINALLSVTWGLLNPDMFASIADTIEDVMQASVPSVIENVRVSEIDQGNNPIRILSIRSLPDGHVQDLQKNIREDNKKNKDPQEAAADEEGGDYYNLEVSFAYHAKPSGESASAKARNMHMHLVFYLGIKGLFGIPFPIFTELIELIGTVRLRLQMTPQPPFAKSVTFSFMGLPHVRAGCVPLVKRGVNILNLPLISNFVNYAIGAAASLYVAPKSMSLDLGMILKGDDIQKDTLALGVFWIRIHRAVGLSKQDRRGSEGGGSDPYINLSFSKYGKPMYCTRVITDDLNPVWEETAALLVTPELIKADEQLSVELWDSDRNSADDIVGKVELSIQKMIQHPGIMYPQVSRLEGMDEGSSMPGELRWEVGYFGKPRLRPELRTDGENHELPETLRHEPTLQDEKGVISTEDEDAVSHTPPDPLWPSGICSIVIHQIVNLQLENIHGTQGSRKGKEFEPAKPYGENAEEQGKDLPTGYCTILLNDQLVYRTRAKAVSSRPIFNAGTERFVRDWRSAIVTVTVRDQRHREHDPILGVVSLKLVDLMKTSSQVTRWYPLDGGIGFGRIRISLLFRSVETKLPSNMLGWDVGTFEFLSERITLKDFSQSAKLWLRTGGSTGKISRSYCKQDGDDHYFDLSQTSAKPRLPVKYRYRSPVVFEFRVSGKRRNTAYAVLWLQHLVDNEETPIDIPIWTTKRGDRLTQNYVTEENCKTLGLDALEDLTEVGRLQFTGRFSAGMDESHEQFVADNDSRETFETWEACQSEGLRDRHVTVEIPETVRDLHEKSLVQGRDVLRESDTNDRKRWIAKDGRDWSGAFGEDPRDLVDKRADGHNINGTTNETSNDYDENDDDADSNNDGSSEEDTTTNSASLTTSSSAGQSNKSGNKANKRSEHRKQRGLMQWKPARNAAFAKDEATFALRKMKKKFGIGDLTGREPNIETETGS
ncbi:C2 domain protein [Talaromyces proteolyticus]|uniref:C2 domain protein n=1 Tax=Talaromyces proteolyticus TaxID=1131652 RepID=A0AAD4KPT6_9EURO|nr:C2 domain protein [Talaromyces proteolyticus]KAH8697657.1 C2 domain protein [Talaromyces proteolyticus]